DKPKQFLLLQGKPILWHIMKIYSANGINDFIICCGYKGYLIKEYFSNYFLHNADVTFDVRNNNMQIHQNIAEPWSVTLIDTGEHSMTGGRLKRVKDYLDGDFCFTYGDGVGNINIAESIKFYKQQNTLSMVTAVNPTARFGALEIQENKILSFKEKPKGEGGMINGGFFVLSPKVIDYIADDNTLWEKEPLEKLALEGQLSVYKHEDFWQPMDTLRDKNYLEELWQSGNAPWKIW
ncbi:MAG: glucose-1-phosphate cytidylyltransferase, partial [Chryseobacterium sp.]